MGKTTKTRIDIYLPPKMIEYIKKKGEKYGGATNYVDMLVREWIYQQDKKPVGRQSQKPEKFTFYLPPYLARLMEGKRQHLLSQSNQYEQMFKTLWEKKRNEKKRNRERQEEKNDK